ncbi:MAG: methyltransferase domain-containing protein [Dyadobacter sp.]|uniref:methyltransferase domain-containing protein n=1 Tax=Dyadobacter sp. TaxID=1914288 RepID=UPI001B2E763C|nr:methyltransferase domain-containing protein [Dyadobacter sp.]MBO9613026.1 methyltransferase domain-containing protein [Dyadobacter sp.]
MAWNPDTYNRFKSERSAPFYDLLALLKVQPDLNVIDLGCGTGELTALLAEALPGSHVLGVDSSREMLDKSVKTGGGVLRFECISIEDQLKKQQQWDVVLSNAALQWVPDHETLFPRIITKIKPGGQLLVQMPAQHHNLTNQLLEELGTWEPYADIYQGWNRVSPVLEINRYAEILFENGSKSMQVFEKIYPLVLDDVEALLTWVSGTALIPYLERLPEHLKSRFRNDYRVLLHQYFPKMPVFYPFKRILMAAQF